MREQEAEEEEEGREEEEEVAEEETGVWRAFVIWDVLLARHSPLLLCSFAAVSSLFLFVFFFLFLLHLLVLPRGRFLFFLRFSMRGLETRLINIAGVAASLFSRVPSSQSAFTGHCTHDARMYYECRPFPPSPSLLSAAMCARG